MGRLGLHGWVRCCRVGIRRGIIGLLIRVAGWEWPRRVGGGRRREVQLAARACSITAVLGVLVSVSRSCVASLHGLGVGNRLERAGGLERLVGFLLLQMVRVSVLDSEAGAVESGVRDDLDGQLVLDDGRDAMLCSLGGDGVCAQRSHAQRHHTDRPADRHAAEDVTFPRDVRHVELVEVLLDDVALLAGVVDGRGREGDSDARDAHRQREGQTGDARRCGGAGDQARVVLPFPLQLLGREPVALLVVLLEVERHRGGTDGGICPADLGTVRGLGGGRGRSTSVTEPFRRGGAKGKQGDSSPLNIKS